MTDVRGVMEALGEMYPWELAEAGDNSGLQVGALDAGVRGVLCALDVTRGSIDHASRSGLDLIVSHHPLIFRPLSSIDSGTPTGSLINGAIAAGVSVVSCHTSADAAEGGTADLLAESLGLENVEPLQRSGGACILKLVVFVPPTAVEDVSSSLAAAGAGAIGRYSHCTFRSAGKGTFLPRPGTSPFSGETGKFNVVDEIRLETVVPSFLAGRAVRAMVESHPYEEVAFDIYRTEIPVHWGLGRTGRLPGENTLEELAGGLRRTYGRGRLAVFGDRGRLVETVAVVPGSANSLVEKAGLAGADALVAGELNYHATAEALERGLSLVVLGHGESERPLVSSMADGLMAAAARRGWDIEVDVYGNEEVVPY